MVTRKEERYIIETSKAEKFIEELKPIISPEVFSVDYNHTLYFNNSEHEVPFEASIKGRRYASGPFSGNLDPEEEWIFEIKRDIISENSRLREKQRENLRLKEILEKLSKMDKIETSPINFPLGPYVVDSYRRRHYRGGDDFRITLDDNLVYHFLEGGFSGKEIGREDYTRVEVKIPVHKISSAEVQRISNVLNMLEAEQIISKKDMAYNLLSKYLRNKYGRSVPSSDIEIEAKLLLDKEHQHVFNQIKNDIENKSIEGFVIPKEFPYVLEGGKLHYYIINPQNDYLRISVKGKAKTIISKENSEIIGDAFGLNCIIKRKEIKEPLSDDVLSLPSKIIYRKRKYFIAENEKTRNSYSILIDRSTYDHNELFQMEIEGLLLNPSATEETEIIQEIADLTNKLIKKYPILKPAPLTKLDWLKTLI